MTAFSYSEAYAAWGRAHRFGHRVARPAFADELPSTLAAAPGTALAYGVGRSYGDECLNRDGALIDMRGLNRFIRFDRETGVLEAEAGVTLADILRLTAGAGPNEGAGQEGAGQGARWFLPVTPGTKFVTLGGAVANDVHGKNHHAAGCFGNHVLSLRLLRSDGSLLNCSPDENAALFRATIGGMGLTGLIQSAAVQLKAVPGPWMEAEDIRYGALDDFFILATESERHWEYTVAWIDCLASGPALGRGIFSRARHCEHAPVGARGERAPVGAGAGAQAAFEPKLAMPLDFPNFALNNLSIRAFNALYWRKAATVPARRIVGYDPVFYPLDAIGQWNRMYGRRGFYQYQCAVPTATARDAVRELLTAIAAAGQGSFLAVLKTLGDVASPGMMSFPTPGATLALDFPNNGTATHRLLDRLDAIVAAAGGRLYAAKDGRMSPRMFQQGYPQWVDFARHVDPKFSSSLWRRVTAATTGAAAP